MREVRLITLIDTVIIKTQIKIQLCLNLFQIIFLCHKTASLRHPSENHGVYLAAVVAVVTVIIRIAHHLILIKKN